MSVICHFSFINDSPSSPEGFWVVKCEHSKGSQLLSVQTSKLYHMRVTLGSCMCVCACVLPLRASSESLTLDSEATRRGSYVFIVSQCLSSDGKPKYSLDTWGHLRRSKPAKNERLDKLFFVFVLFFLYIIFFSIFCNSFVKSLENRTFSVSDLGRILWMHWLCNPH